MPEDTRCREVTGGSLWTGEVFGRFFTTIKKSEKQKGKKRYKIEQTSGRGYLAALNSFDPQV
jgi:hypothetical protein